MDRLFCVGGAVGLSDAKPQRHSETDVAFCNNFPGKIADDQLAIRLDACGTRHHARAWAHGES
jgi:hypothetical protein